MNEATENTLPEPDPDLIEAMCSRVVRRKPQPYGNRKAGPGRPKGSAKTGGRKAGAPNLASPEFRQWLAEKAKPFEILASICAGDEIEDAGKKRKPTLSERMRAAETIVRKLVPDLCATTLTGAEGGPLEISPAISAATMSDFELARRLAFLLAKGMHDAKEGATQPVRVASWPDALPALQSHPKAAEEPVREDKWAGALTASFAEAPRSPGSGLAR